MVGSQPLQSDAGSNGAHGEKSACCHGVGRRRDPDSAAAKKETWRLRVESGRPEGHSLVLCASLPIMDVAFCRDMVICGGFTFLCK